MKEEKISVNDGSGLYDNLGLIDTLIEDCNMIPKILFSGNNVQFCSKIVEMVQKLINLKTGIENDMNGYKRQISDLRQMVNEYGVISTDA